MNATIARVKAMMPLRPRDWMLPLSVLLAGCAAAPPRSAAPKATPLPPPARIARAEVALAPASASLVSGRLVLVANEAGVHITGTLGGLPPNGRFGFHVHARGDCSAIDASSAGGHFDPDGRPHGRRGEGSFHAGDMDNLTSDAEGVARVDRQLDGLHLGGERGHDLLGRAIIVHAGADDYRSQPAGAAGARVACGVIRPLAADTP